MDDNAPLPTYRTLVRAVSRVRVLRGLAAFLRGVGWNHPNAYVPRGIGEAEARKLLDEHEHDDTTPSREAYRAIVTRDYYSDR